MYRWPSLYERDFIGPFLTKYYLSQAFLRAASAKEFANHLFGVSKDGAEKSNFLF